MEMASDAIHPVVYRIRGNAMVLPTVETFLMRKIVVIVRKESFIAETKYAYLSRKFVMVLKTVPTEGMKDSAVNIVFFL